MKSADTIAAIATPSGQAGVGVIRISGPLASNLGVRLFRPSHPPCSWQSHRAYHGDIVSADSQTVLDEVLVTLMRSPHSFTGEDVLEISCHGNPVILQTILEQLMLMGCRLAGPGEFSRRAFLNGRMDLSQAEALATMISARSARAFAVGLAQLKGHLGRDIHQLRDLLIEALALLEAAIDFTDDVAEDETPDLPPQIIKAIGITEDLLSTYRSARILTQGISVVITGKPNVGKSSLLNRLAGKKKAIVTDIPGTTRDLITETITVDGISLHLVDTAGIRKPQDAIEKEGIDLVWEHLELADIVVILLDGSKPLTEEDHHILSQNQTRAGKVLIASNKSDLPAAWTREDLIRFFSPNVPFINLSAKFGEGLDHLRKALVEKAGMENRAGEGGMIIQLRHKLALERTHANLVAARGSLENGQSPEFAAFELREAVDALDEITGQKIREEILDKIFSSFCIGK